jgi:hypothetical protein
MVDATVAPERREMVDRIARARERGGPAPDSYESVSIRKDGTRLPVLVQARALQLSDGPAVIAFVTDLTERTRAEERFRAAVEASPLAVGMHRGGRGLFMNGAFMRLFGIARVEDGIGRPIAVHIAPSCRERVAEFARRRVTGEPAPPEYEAVGLRTDGTEFPMNVRVASVVLSDGPATLVFIEDLTDKRRAEEALRASEERLRQTQKMEALGRLAGGVAHDFNNLLQVIGGFADMLRLRLPAEGPLSGHAEQIVAAVARAAGLVRQLLAFSRRQVVERRVQDLNGIVMGALDLLRRLVGVEIELVTQLGGDAGRVRVDRVEIEQVLMNLVANARDAMPGGGRITVATRSTVVSADEAARTPGSRPGPHAVLEVADTGEGISAEIRAHLFEPFYTTKAPGAGTGLGLATVYGIISQCGGQILVESEPGCGARFRILLPSVVEPADETPARRDGGLPGGTESVLVVEDDMGVLSFLGGALQLGGYRVTKAASPAEAEAAIAQGGSFDLLVTDVVMAGLPGPELASRLHALRPGLRVLFVSGHTSDDRVPERQLLRKPFDAETLLRRVRETLDAAAPGEPGGRQPS